MADTIVDLEIRRKQADGSYKIYHPVTKAKNVKAKDGTDLESHLVDLAQLSNPNLIINGDFQVWQRGAIFNSGHSKYIADRWYLAYHSASSYEIKSVVNGLSIKSDGNNQIFIKQLIENSLKFIGCKVTLSIKIDGVIAQASAIVPSSGDFCIISNGAYLQVTDKTLNVVYHTSSSTPKIIEWVKLELGDKATPFVPRLIGEEKALCERYYRDETIEFKYSNVDLVYSAIKGYGNSMRLVPTLTFGTIQGIYDTIFSDITVTTGIVHANGVKSVVLSKLPGLNQDISIRVKSDSEIY